MLGRSRMVAVAVALAAATTFSMGGGVAVAANPTDAPKAPAAADVTADGAVAPMKDWQQASGSDQCDLPLAQRTGDWLCMQQAADDPGATSGTVTPMASIPNSWCLTNTCWYVIDDKTGAPGESTHAHDSSTGYFGAGGTQLGRLQMEDYQYLNGAQMVTKTQFSANTNVTNLGVSGDLLHGSLDGDGIETGNNYQERHKDSLAANTWWKPWSLGKYGGYRSYDNNFTNHSNVIEYEWSKPGYAGVWWMYVKSVVANDPDKEVYVFSDSKYLYKHPANGHWNIS